MPSIFSRAGGALGRVVQSVQSLRTDAMRQTREGYVAAVSQAARADNVYDPYLYERGSGGGWRNPVTGLGTFGRDKVLQGRFAEPVVIPWTELAAMYNGNDLCQRICTTRPREMLRLGYKVKLPDDQGDTKQSTAQSDAIHTWLKDHDVNGKFLEGEVFGGLFGGGLLIVGAIDGKDPSEPLDEENIDDITYLSFLDRRWLAAHTWYSDPFAPKFGEVESYIVTSSFGEVPQNVVHESRVIRFDGTPVDILKRRQLAGWTLSRLQAPYDVLRQFDSSFQAISNLMTDMSQAVLKMNGLMQMISSDEQTLQTRMALVDMTRSSGRMVLLDAENEDFERKATPLSGVPETLEVQMLRVASAAEMPVTLLFGRSPQGMNATGDADFRRFYDLVDFDRRHILEPKLLRFLRLVCLAKKGPTGGKLPPRIDIDWPKLWVPTEKERSEIYLNMSRADCGTLGYVGMGVLTPAETATTRFKDGQLQLDTQIDMAAHQELAKKQSALRAKDGPFAVGLTPGGPLAESSSAQAPADGEPRQRAAA